MGKHTTEEERKEIIKLYKAEVLLKTIATRMNRPISTISTIISEYKKKTGQRIPRSNQSKRSLNETDKVLINNYIKENRTIFVGKLQNALKEHDGTFVSLLEIQQYLKSIG